MDEDGGNTELSSSFGRETETDRQTDRLAVDMSWCDILSSALISKLSSVSDKYMAFFQKSFWIIQCYICTATCDRIVLCICV